jgi:diguanylate cyclase
LFRIGAAGDADAVTQKADSPALPLVAARREELLNRIHDLFIDHSLEVTPANLLAAHAAFSGSSPRLARKLTLMRSEDRAITQEWLDAAMADGQPVDNEQADADALMIRLGSGLDTFAKATKSARTVTGKYQSALEQTAQTLTHPEVAGAMIASLADLTRTMIKRTRQMEAGMRKSEQEVSALRQSLARAQRDAKIDFLTGLPNRRAFEDVLERQYREAQAAIEPLSIAFCDIDHFKRVNDCHGHETGDRVIQAIAQALARISNENCHVARHGGEEFVMLFRGMPISDAYRLLDNARQQLADRSFVNRKTDEPIGGITFSGGVADVFGYPDPRAALEAADAALYRAKRGGRNQICIAG